MISTPFLKMAFSTLPEQNLFNRKSSSPSYELPSHNLFSRSSPPRRAPPSSSPPLPSSLPDNLEPSKALDLRRPRTRPPPPTCEDEIDALAHEYGALSVSDDEVQSRGDFEQYPILLEVHEHNPERRFVLVPEGSDGLEGRAKDEGSDSERRPSERPADERPRTPTRRFEPVFEDGLKAGDERPNIGRRRSRHGDLPPINTSSRQDVPPPRPRTRSAVGSRPEGFSARQSARFGDDMLSPDVIKNGPGRRDANYHSGSSTSGPRKMHHQRSYSNMVDDRRRDRPQRRESLSPANGIRSESNPDPRKSSRRRLSTESRYRDEPGGPRTSSRRESTLSSRRADVEGTPTSRTSKPLGPRGPRRDESRSSEDQSASSRINGRRGHSTSVHQDVPPRVSEKDDTFHDPRARSREPSVPAYVPTSGVPKDTPVNPRSSVTFPLPTEDPHTRLPYPDDTRTNRAPAYNGQAPPTASMPNIPNGVPANSARPLNSGRTADTKGTPTTATSSAWPPPAFVPERDGLPTDRKDTAKGDFRRFSEGEAMFGVPSFPECPRVKPVAGKTDWLTLPRTEFNICPDCYQGVFFNTEYETLFQPILRPTDRPISCDFGSSPWYRIAYLLTRKNRRPDLQLLHQVDAAVTTMKNQPCPGSRKALRNWYGIRDPYKRRAVPNFTACLQCAKTVEVLLPNLMGVFVPLDSRSAEPVGSVCSLHFEPQRQRFAQYFDTLAHIADSATSKGQPPDLIALASEIEHLSALGECRQDVPMLNAYWHSMQCLPEMSVCASCFDEFVRPKLSTETLARNFYKDTQKMREATCQLYSKRMRGIFDEACRRNDARYLQEAVRKRVLVEADIRSQLMKLDREGNGDAWADAQIEHLVSEWRNKWE